MIPCDEQIWVRRPAMSDAATETNGVLRQGDQASLKECDVTGQSAGGKQMTAGTAWLTAGRMHLALGTGARPGTEAREALW